jgi:hypothetical protein
VGGIGTGYGLDDRGDRSLDPSSVQNFELSISSRPDLGPTQLPIQSVAEDLSSRVKRHGHEPGQSPPTCAVVKET